MNSSLKVTQVNAVIAEVYGGPSIGSVALNAKLRELGVDATLYSTALSGGTNLVLNAAERARFAATGAQTRLFEPAWPSALQNGKGFFQAILREARVTDLIHIHGQYQLPHVYAYFAARRAGVPYGVQVHGGLEPYQRAKSRWKKRIYNLLVGNRILRNAAYVHFSSPSEAERARDVVRPEQELVVPLGASLPPERPVASLAGVLGKNRASIVLFLGRLTHKKRPDLLLDAWAKTDRPKGSLLIIAGPDEDVSASQLRSQAQGLGISKSVLFPGQVSGPEKAWLYRHSGTFVLASENENFGLTVGEAMLGGCHVIASEGVAASEFLRLARSGAVLSEMTSESLAASLGRALKDPEMIAESGKRAATYADERLGWEPLAKAIATQARRAHS